LKLEYSEEQLMLKTSARDYLYRECPFNLIKDIRTGKQDPPLRLWQGIANLGWTSLIFSKQYDGAECNFMDFVTLLQETGRVLMPIPLLQSVIGGMAINAGGNKQQKTSILTKIASGEIISSLAIAEEDGDYNFNNIKTKAVFSDGYYTLTGNKQFLTASPITDVFIVAAKTLHPIVESGTTLLIIPKDSPGLSIKEQRASTGAKFYQLILDKVTVSPQMVLGEPGKGLEIIEPVLLFEAVAKCANIVGSVERVLELTTEYAKSRVQFNHPIGSFQAVQQVCADMVIDVDSIKFATYRAASLLDQGIECAREVAIARLLADAVYERITVSGVKIHGGIGFTMEHEVGFHFLNAIDSKLPYTSDNYYRRLLQQTLY
jgi:alkylation response protein AidB-like acyl-CoA dehydrogenase